MTQIKKAILYAFDYMDSMKLNLQSSVSDVHLIWTLLTSKYQLSMSDIVIVGQLDLKGKMLPWKQRYYTSSEWKMESINIFLEDVTQLFVYFTAHGSAEGLLLYGSEMDKRTIQEVIPIRFLNSNQTWIVADMCYSHLFTSMGDTIVKSENTASVFIPCSGKHPAALSTSRGSIFTIGFVSKLIQDPENFFDWIVEETYHTSQKATLPFSC
jgi:hypothetical protein